jgi:tetratricopeptide (TPR) repeat protein
VVQAGSYISKSGCGLATYIRMYRERRIGLLEEYRNQVQTIDDYEWTVYTTWAASFDKLSPRAVIFLNICAFFHHDGISAKIFQKAAANIKIREIICPQGSIGPDIAEEFLSSFHSTDGHWDHHEFLAVISEIRSYSLIEFDERNEMYSIHPLVHSWTRSRASNTTLHDCSQFILAMSIMKTRRLEDLAFNQTLLPHIDASLEGGTVADSGTAAWLWYPYHKGGRWKEAEALGLQAVEMSKRVLGDEHRDTLMNMSNLAKTYSRMERLKEAEKLYSQVMDVFNRIYGEEDPEMGLRCMQNLASTYSRMGRWEEAEGLQVQEMEMSKCVFGEDHPHTLRSMSKLASTYARMGQLKEAEELEVRAMEKGKKISGEEHPDTIMAMANLATTYYERGRWKEAEELGARAVEASKRILGEDHPDTLTRIDNLSEFTEKWMEEDRYRVINVI